MERLTLRDALASDRLDAFVRQEEDRGVELVAGSDMHPLGTCLNESSPRFGPTPRFL